ncbi:MAG: hypothetical protein MJ211_01610 [Bacteroidales bacterium]|nr:hypothetical protein [Bacteroidales bacterium]
MKNYLLILILLIFASCSQNQSNKTCYYPVPEEVTMLTEDNMPKVETFTLEKIPLPTKYLMNYCYVYQDSLVVSINYSNPNPYIISVYNLNTQQEIAGYFKKGNGPNELMSFNGYLHNNNLFIRDGNLHALTQLNMDSVILKGNNYTPIITFCDALLMSDFVYLGNDTIVSANGMFIKGFDVDEVNEFELYDAKTGKALKEYPLNEKNFPPPTVLRTMTFSNSKFIVFWEKFPIISIYDKNFNIISQFRDAIFDDNVMSFVDDNNTIASKEYFSFYFNFSCKTENNIIVHNFRYNIKYKDLKSPEEIDANATYETWIFDADMNLKRRLKPEVKLENVRKVSYSEKSNTFYLNCNDEDGELALYKCILK